MASSDTYQYNAPDSPHDHQHSQAVSSHIIVQSVCVRVCAMLRGGTATVLDLDLDSGHTAYLGSCSYCRDEQSNDGLHVPIDLMSSKTAIISVYYIV